MWSPSLSSILPFSQLANDVENFFRGQFEGVLTEAEQQSATTWPGGDGINTTDTHTKRTNTTTNQTQSNALQCQEQKVHWLHREFANPKLVLRQGMDIT